jgi:hypothetical protein
MKYYISSETKALRRLSHTGVVEVFRVPARAWIPSVMEAKYLKEPFHTEITQADALREVERLLRNNK